MQRLAGQRTWTLRRLALAWVALVASAMGLLLVLEVLTAAENDARADAHRRAGNELARLAVAAESLVLREPSVLAEMLAQALLDPAVEAAVVVDPQRRILLSSRSRDVGQPFQTAQPALFALLPQTQSSEQLVEQEDPQTRRLVAARSLNWPASSGELRGRARGAVFVVVGLGQLVDEQRRQALNDHIGQGLVLLMAFVLLMLGLEWLVVRPVNRLRKAALQMGEGDLTHRVASTRVQEVDDLGQALNQMATGLQASLQRLKDGEQRFRALTESAPDAIIILDDQGCVTQFNAAAERLFGYGAQELLGQPLDRLLPPAVTSGHSAHLGRFASEEPTSARRMQAGRVVKGLHRDGHLLHLEIGISRSLIAGALSFTAMIRDVSDRVAVEQELDAQRRQLEDQVRQRTVELVMERDRAQAATRAKNEFLARMSHEIRTPMNAVVGLAHVVRRNALPSQVNQLQTLEDSALQLLALVDDILEFTRLEAGQVALLAAPADLRALVHAVCQPLAARAGRVGVELVEWVEADVPDSVSLDAQRVRQLLGHLVDNAVKFTPSGHVTVRVSLCTVGLRFEVHDTGIGIEPDALGRLFKPFEQADPGDARRFGGAGLGLVLTQRLLRLMGADLQASSQPGEGTRFHFELRAPAVQTRDAPRPAPLPARRALVVETQADARAAQLALLRYLGLEAEGASSLVDAQAALARMAQGGRPADLCLLDARLLAAPETEGAPAPDPATALGGHHCVLTVLDGHAPMLAQVLQAGYLGVLSKPLARDTVQERLSAWLSAPPPQRPALRAPPPPAPRLPEPTPMGMEALQDLHAVPGLDVSAGLRTLRGDVPAYWRLLRHFVNFHGEDPLRLQQLLDRGEGREVADLAHSLKSSAGAIGAMAVVAATAAVPRNGEPLLEVRATGQALATQMASLLAALTRILGGSLPAQGGAAAARSLPLTSEAERNDLLRNLRESLQRRDMAALRMLHGGQGSALEPLGAHAARLRRAVEDFDFDVALQLLDQVESEGQKAH